MASEEFIVGLNYVILVANSSRNHPAIKKQMTEFINSAAGIQAKLERAPEPSLKTGGKIFKILGEILDMLNKGIPNKPQHITKASSLLIELDSLISETPEHEKN